MSGDTQFAQSEFTNSLFVSSHHAQCFTDKKIHLKDCLIRAFTEFKKSNLLFH